MADDRRRSGPLTSALSPEGRGSALKGPLALTEGEGVSLIALAVLAILLFVPLASCGKKGPLEPPPGGSTTYPQVYPRE